MSATNTFENDLLLLIFNNTAIETIGDSAGIQGSTSDGSLYVALFTATPDEAGSTSNECTYTGYARVAVARTSAGWTISGNNASNTSAVTFGECTAGTETATHFGIADSSSGGTLLFYGALDSSLAISSGVIPEFAAGDLDINAD